MRDLKSQIDSVQSLLPAARTNGTATGAAVDLQGFQGAVAEFVAGAWTDGSHTPTIFDSADGTTYAQAAAQDLQPGVAVAGTAQQNANQRVGYLGSKRYIKPALITTGATTGAVVGANVLRGYPNNAPV